MDAIEWITALVVSAWIIEIVLCIYVALCLQNIARKTDTEPEWLAWIPIANLYLMCKIAQKPWWWVLLFFIPIANIVILVLVWMRIAEARDKNRWLGLLILVPLANLIFLGYLAFSGKGRQAELVGSQGNITVPAYLAYAGEATFPRGVRGQPVNGVRWQVGERARGGTIETRKMRGAEVQANREMKETRKSIPDIGPETYEDHVRLVIPPSVELKQVAQFKEHLEEVKDLTIVMTGGAANEGSIIVVAGQKQSDLIPILNEMAMIKNVRAKGEETILVVLKTPEASKESG
ncbi:MAG: hypothetical protein JW732_06530 [Dehalococcoidia bacterium]|nr:hypothetical protein [Dehalococcoidia bacterium]